MAMTNNQIAATVAVVALVVIAGGAAVAAGNAQPGDTLYPLRASLFASDETRANASIDAAQESRDEAVRLQTDGSFTASERTRLMERYRMRIQEAEDFIISLENNNEVDAAARIRARLRAFMDDDDGIFGDAQSSLSSSSSSSSDASASTSASAMSSDQTTTSSSSSSQEDDDTSSASNSAAASTAASVGTSTSVGAQ